LDEDGNRHRRIEVQLEFAGGALHRSPVFWRGDEFSAARAMVELSGGMHSSKPLGCPSPLIGFQEYGFGRAAEN
jgi:hypothetical protein